VFSLEGVEVLLDLEGDSFIPNEFIYRSAPLKVLLDPYLNLSKIPLSLSKYCLKVSYPVGFVIDCCE
jgi:hypothetical protein